MNLFKLKSVILSATIFCVSLAHADPPTELPPAAVELADFVKRMATFIKDDLGAAASGLIEEVVRHQGVTLAEAERAFRRQNVPVHLMAVHRSHQRSLRNEIVGIVDGLPREYFVLVWAGDAESAEAHRRARGIADEQTNLANLDCSGLLSQTDDPAVIAREITRFVGELSDEVARANELIVDVVATRAVYSYLIANPDISPRALEAELRRQKSPVHLFAELPDPAVKMKVVPIGERPLSEYRFVLEVMVGDTELVAEALDEIGCSAEQNLLRLETVGRYTESTLMQTHRN